jgi:hypothetical protein
VRLVVGFGWVEILLGFGKGVGLIVGRGFVVGRMMTKLVGVDQSNIVAQTQIVALLPT